MSADTFYVVVPFVRDERNELVALEPKSASTRYAALREASFSIGRISGDIRIVGAVVFNYLKVYAVASTAYWQFLLGTVLLVLVLALPTGIVGTMSRQFGKLGKRE